MATYPWIANDEQRWTGKRTLLRMGVVGAVVCTVLQVAAGTSQAAQLGGSAELAVESLAGQQDYARFRSLDGHLPLTDTAGPTPYSALCDLTKMATARPPQAIRVVFSCAIDDPASFPAGYCPCPGHAGVSLSCQPGLRLTA